MTDYVELKKIVEGLVRVGTVTDVNNKKRIARVKFQSEDFTSGWLQVLNTRDFIPDYDVDQRTEYEAGGSGAAAFERHKHDLIIKPYMPKINDTVLCLYLPCFNADGVVLGGLDPV